MGGSGFRRAGRLGLEYEDVKRGSMGGGVADGGEWKKTLNWIESF
jgi:hypothetical protein